MKQGKKSFAKPLLEEWLKKEIWNSSSKQTSTSTFNPQV